MVKNEAAKSFQNPPLAGFTVFTHKLSLSENGEGTTVILLVAMVPPGSASHGSCINSSSRPRSGAFRNPAFRYLFLTFFLPIITPAPSGSLISSPFIFLSSRSTGFTD